MKVLCDTSVFVAQAIAEHEHHARASALVAQIKAAKNNHGFVAAHSLVEIYAVLTRLPLSPRVTPEGAEKIITGNVLAFFAVAALDAREHLGFVLDLARRGIVGGATYDALILRCAEKAKVDRIYTFNVKHFRALAPHLENRIAAP
jgi:predicted nucleic acid-binding protein